LEGLVRETVAIWIEKFLQTDNLQMRLVQFELLMTIVPVTVAVRMMKMWTHLDELEILLQYPFGY
jgi:hypothetical protein